MEARRRRVKLDARRPMACGLAAIAVDASLFHFVTRSIADATRAIVKLRTELDHIDAVQDALSEAEGAVRAYVLSGRAEDLEPYSQATTRADDALRALAVIPHESADSQAQVDAFMGLGRDRLQILGRAIDANRAGNRAGAVDVGTSLGLSQVYVSPPPY